jgi:hypothetical protein
MLTSVRQNRGENCRAEDKAELRGGVGVARTCLRIGFLASLPWAPWRGVQALLRNRLRCRHG